MIVVFSDLDGTLLDHETYDFEPARPALDLLARMNIPVVLASSKTEAEMRPIAAAMGLTFPMIVENGAGVAEPEEGAADPSADHTYRHIRRLLRELPASLTGTFIGFGDWTAAEVARHTGLPTEAAGRARQRRFSEPGLFSGSEAQRSEFDRVLADGGFQTVQGGRFLTVMPKTSKAERMAELADRFRIMSGEPVRTIALGDAPNDLAMLEAADTGVIIANPAHPALPVTHRETTGSIVRSSLPGPAGWNEMILKLVTTE